MEYGTGGIDVCDAVQEEDETGLFPFLVFNIFTLMLQEEPSLDERLLLIVILFNI